MASAASSGVPMRQSGVSPARAAISSVDSRAFMSVSITPGAIQLTRFESGKSSIYSYECGCDELKKLYEIMADTDGIYGGRFSGAGFKGCCMALIDPDKAEDIEAKVGAEYLKAFPALVGKYSFHLCESADGVEL